METSNQILKFSITWQSSATSRKRVVATIYLENGDDEVNDSTLYRYDINGNVKTLKQFIKALAAVDTNRYRQIDYDYDLVSGKVNKVSYQFGKGDQFFYRYNYDAENRLQEAYSSRDGLVWNEEASYNYYLHGPLARTELGKFKVQGMDYAYTLQGWLKGINADGLNPALKIGQDGQSGTTFGRVSRDVFAMQLGYYQQDYSAIGAGTAFANRQYQPPSLQEATGNQLFNGNISYTTVTIKGINNDSTTGYTYGYDQLNRLLEMRQHTVSGNWSNSNILDAYRESIAYDANGNILKYLRHGANQPGRPLEMDSLNYKYNRDIHGKLVNNKLNYVTDQVNAEAYLPDIDNEKPDNYRYDKIGNLIRDRAEGIDTIHWTVYGKIHQIVKATGDVITYGYDAGGNRTSKQVTYTDTTVSTYYLRDAQGNVLAVYGNTSYNNEVKWKEQHLYGSSRLGMWRSDTVVASAPPVVQNNGTLYDSLLYGSRTYELTNHLGNVMVTISDKKVGVDSAADGTVAYYAADVRTAQDYYPFGMLMPGRMTYEGDYRWVPVDPSQIPEDVPEDLVLDQPRVSGDPAEYKATNSITMQPDFSSMTGDEFLAHIVEDDGLDPSDYATASRYTGVRSEYPYGFNGKENDDDVKGTGNQLDFESRIHDARLGRFLSLDPLQKKYPKESNYIFTSDNPIFYADLDGRDKITTVKIIQKDGSVIVLKKTDKSKFDYLMDASYSGGYLYSKRDIYQNVVYDMRKAAMGDNPLSKIETSYGIPNSITASEYYGRPLRSLSNWIEGIANSIGGDQSNQVKYGYAIYGKGGSMEYSEKLPRAAQGSEVLNLADWLDFHSDLREGESFEDLSEILIKKLGGPTGDMKSISEAVDIMSNQLENISEAVDKIHEVAEKHKNQIEQCESCGSFRKNGKDYDTANKKVKPSEIIIIPIDQFHR